MLYIFFILSFVIILVGAYCAYDSLWTQKFEEEWAQKEKERKKSELRLTDSLKTLCTQLGIKVTYHKELGTDAGQIVYKKNLLNGRFSVGESKIQILKEYSNEPWVLAHELGHYFAIKTYQDRSEEAADREADKLCRAILNDHEQEMLKIGLECHFHQEEVT